MEGLRWQVAARILVVDDYPPTADLIEATLGEAGYHTEAASDGFEALAKVEASPPDLILLDVMMPDLDGFEICRRLKARPATAFIPVVLITALRDAECRMTGIEAGADDFLTKPLNRPELLARVRSLLRIKRLHDQVEASRALLEQRVAERTADLEGALRQLQALNRSRAEFLATITHELRTPLAPITGYLHTLLAEALGPLSPDQREGLAAMRQSVDRLRQLIENLLAFARMERRDLCLQLQPVGLGALLEPCLAEATRLAGRKRQSFRADLPPDLPPVLADPRELPRAIGHLLENATKFTPEGGSVRLAARRLPGGGHVEIRVADTGIGIPPDQQQRIFEPFHQVDGSPARRYEGAGLGLAVVRQILTAHGAKIEVDSRPGEGTTFRFSLPGGTGGGQSEEISNNRTRNVE